MATILFGKDEGGVVFKVMVKASKVQPLLAAGYVCDPVEFEAPTKEEADTNNTGKLSVEEVRAAAKKAGIRNWHNKKIDNLKEVLGYVD